MSRDRNRQVRKAWRFWRESASRPYESPSRRLYTSVSVSLRKQRAPLGPSCPQAFSLVKLPRDRSTVPTDGSFNACTIRRKLLLGRISKLEFRSVFNEWWNLKFKKGILKFLLERKIEKSHYMDYFKKKNLLLFLNNIYLIVIVTFERKENSCYSASNSRTKISTQGNERNEHKT